MSTSNNTTIRTITRYAFGILGTGIEIAILTAMTSIILKADAVESAKIAIMILILLEVVEIRTRTRKWL